MKKISLFLIPPFCFFLTGFSSLIDEVVWTKIISLIFGSTLIATGFVLFLYMLFLGIGSAMGGKISAVSKEPLKIFGIFEILIGILTIISPFLFDLVKNFSYKSNNNLPYLFSFLILSPIILLMGTTFPIFLKALKEDFENSSKIIGIVYGLNLLGAGIGSFCGGFLLLPMLGVKKSLLFAGFIDIIAGTTSFFISKVALSQEKEIKGEKLEKQVIKSIFIAFFSGMAALTLEVAWFRCLSLFIGSSTYAFTLMVSSFILGLFIGSFFLSNRADKEENVFQYLSEIHLLICFFSTIVSVVLISVPFFYINIIKITGAKFLSLSFLLFLFLILLFLFPTSLMGTSLPVAIKASSSKYSSKKAGLVYGSSSLGSALGAIFSSILIPFIGLKSTIFLAFIFSLISNFIAYKKNINFKLLILIFIIWLMWIFNFFPWDWRILTAGYYAYAPYYASNFSEEKVNYRNLKLKNDPPFGKFLEDLKEKEFEGTKLLFLKEGIFSQVAVVQDRGIKSLLINGKTDASNGIEDMRTQLLLGHLPALLLKEIKGNACVIGLGSGVTAGAITTYNFKKIYVIEIEKEVLNGSKYFKEENLNFSKDKRVIIKLKDARKEIFQINEKFTIITSEPSNLWMSGTSSLFTYEFFKEIYKKLENNGIFCQWIHLYQISPKDIKIFLKTINSVFPHLLLYADGEDLLVLSSKNKINLNPYIWLYRIEKNERLRYWFGKVGFIFLSDFAKNFIMDENGLKFLIKDEKIHKDDFPILEYSAAKWLGFDFSKEILMEIIEAGKKAGPIELINFGFIE